MALRTVAEAIRYVEDTLAANPERDGLAAEAAACAGRPRPYACLYLGHLHDPDDRSDSPPHWTPPSHHFGDDAAGQLAGEILGLLGPLDLLNPVSAVLSPGGARSPADLIPSFGTPLSADRGAAACTRPIADLLREPEPDPDTAGLMPEFRGHIALVRELTPPTFKIGMPNLQGPFNLLHALAGDDAFLAPATAATDYDRLMTRITDFLIAIVPRFRAWIGPERLRPLDRWTYVAECSVNLVSADFYREHILPYDQRLAAAVGPLRLHPCSGRHVFLATLDGLAAVAATEAGLMRSKMAAACIGVDEALAQLGDRPIVLGIGQELPPKFADAEALIRADLDRARRHPRLLFGYTGMDWRRRDRPAIRDLHRRLDDHWAAHVAR